MEPFLSELPYHIYDWLIISLKDFCIVIRKWPTFLPSSTIGANSGANMFSILPGIKSGPAALEILIFSNNFCIPFKVIDKFPIDGYLSPNNLGVGVAVELFLVNTERD